MNIVNAMKPKVKASGAGAIIGSSIGTIIAYYINVRWPIPSIVQGAIISGFSGIGSLFFGYQQEE